MKNRTTRILEALAALDHVIVRSAIIIFLILLLIRMFCHEFKSVSLELERVSNPDEQPQQFVTETKKSEKVQPK